MKEFNTIKKEFDKKQEAETNKLFIVDPEVAKL